MKCLWGGWDWQPINLKSSALPLSQPTPQNETVVHMGLEGGETCLQGVAINTGTDQPVHPRSLISTFVIRWLESRFVGNPEDRFSRVEAHIEKASSKGLDRLTWNFVQPTLIGLQITVLNNCLKIIFFLFLNQNIYCGFSKERQGTKIFHYWTCPAGQVTYNFHSSCKHNVMHLSFKSVQVCNKEHKGVICNMTSSSNSSQSIRPTELLVLSRFQS